MNTIIRLSALLQDLNKGESEANAIENGIIIPINAEIKPSVLKDSLSVRFYVPEEYRRPSNFVAFHITRNAIQYFTRLDSSANIPISAIDMRPNRTFLVIDINH